MIMRVGGDLEIDVDVGIEGLDGSFFEVWFCFEAEVIGPRFDGRGPVRDTPVGISVAAGDDIVPVIEGDLHAGGGAALCDVEDMGGYLTHVVIFRGGGG